LGRDDVIGIIYVSWVEAIHDPQGDWSVVHWKLGLLPEK
jgi:hypothetical protein